MFTPPPLKSYWHFHVEIIKGNTSQSAVESGRDIDFSNWKMKTSVIIVKVEKSTSQNRRSWRWKPSSLAPTWRGSGWELTGIKSEDELVGEIVRVIEVKNLQGAYHLGPPNLPNPLSPLGPPISSLHRAIRPKTVPQAAAWPVHLKETGLRPCLSL